MNIIEIPKKILDIYIIMGIKLVLSESQAKMLDNHIAQHELAEWGGGALKCYDLSYDALDKFLGKRDEKKLGNATVAIRRNEDIAVKLWDTDIITIDMADILTITVRGWDTMTTKSRLNDMLKCRGVHISQAKNKWTIHGENGSFPYEDGMEIHQGGYIVKPSKMR
jgi:hypothetical protein